jgi:hypothetical protein
METGRGEEKNKGKKGKKRKKEKGVTLTRYYEIVDEAPYFHYLTEFKSSTPQKGMAFLPKRCLNVNECEIARALKLHTNKVSFTHALTYLHARALHTCHALHMSRCVSCPGASAI